MGISKPLVVETVCLYEKENARLHHTQDYDLVEADSPTPVLRRGQPFQMSIRFDRPFDIATDNVRISVSFGKNANELRGTKAVRTLSNETNDKDYFEDWSVRMISSQAENVTVELSSPADSPVGVWKLEIETVLKGTRKCKNYRFDKDIYLLFNPWVKEDCVYMEDQNLLEEYVSNDVGKIWMSTSGGAMGRKWFFGQFDACVLPACELMMERSGIRTTDRGNIIKVSRAISKIVNSNDDRGVISGRWHGDYSDGTHPSAWTGSTPILKKFLKTKDSVKYGQCWVYAGVVTTVCRALGIPSRVISNIVSAHDGNASLSIDNYYDADHNRIPDPSGIEDSIWNFHVWNEAWMARSDLPKGYGGWQAIDATPQETSDGLYQCGPTSVEAIKQGAIGYNYDVPFMLSSVNADVIDWIQDEDNDLSWRPIQRDQRHVGRMLLTKAPLMFDPYGESDREDVVTQYKSIEGSLEERLALRRAARDLNHARRAYEILAQQQEDVKFELVPLEKIQIGDSFDVRVNIENKSERRQTIRAVLSAESIYYNGVKGHLVKHATGVFNLLPGEREVLRVSVSADNYMDKLVEYSYMKLRAIATVVDTKQTWASEDDFQVLVPNIVLKVEDKLVVGKPASISLSFKNPLKEILTDCKFAIAGSKGMKSKMLPVEYAKPGDEVHVKYQFTPQKTGSQVIMATFTSKQLINILGSLPVEVLGKEE